MIVIETTPLIMHEYLDVSGQMFASYYGINKSQYSWECPMDCLAEVIRVFSMPKKLFSDPRSRAFRESANHILKQLGF